MVILLTGGSRGIGAAIKEEFEGKGHRVYAPTRCEMDLSIPHTYWHTYLSEVMNIDILINCAGVNDLKSLGNLRYRDFEELFDINFKASFNLSQYFLPLMVRNNYGRILNIGSIWVDTAKQYRGAYSVSKNALHALTKQIAVEYGQYNVLCNTLSPGFIETEMTFKNNSDEDLAIIQSEIPVKRLGKPEEIAKLAYNLTVENSYITGQNIIIDGGYSICA